MVNFIICEDDKNMVEKITNTIIKYNNFRVKEKYSFNIGLIKDSTDGVIDYVRKNLDKKNIYILDIELKNKGNGINLAKNIRKYDSNGIIIFLTSHTIMAIYVFKYKLKVLDFIDKQDNIEKKLLQNLNNIYNKLLKEDDEGSSIIVKIGTRNYILKFSEIIYFQTTGINGKIRVSTIDEQLEFYGKLKDIEKQLDERFYKSHKSCIINKDHIKMINKDIKNLYILMKNDEKNLLSRNGLKGLIKKND